MLGSPDGGGRVVRHYLADDEPIEEHPDGGEVLLDGRSAVAGTELLDVRSDVNRAKARQVEAERLAPCEEAVTGVCVGSAGVRVADLRREELDVAERRSLTLAGDERRHDYPANPYNGHRASLQGYELARHSHPSRFQFVYHNVLYVT